MQERPNPTKRMYQTRRAQQLCQQVYEFCAEQGHGDDPEVPLAFAQRLSIEQWGEFAHARLGWERPPSVETQVMAIEMVRTRTECERTSARRNCGNQIIRNRSY